MNAPWFIYSSITRWAFVFHFWLFWIKLLWIFQILCGHIFAFFSVFSKYSGVEPMGHRVDLYLASWEIVKHFSKGAKPFYILISNVGAFQLFHIHTNICYCHYFWLQPRQTMWNGISLWSQFTFPWQLKDVEQLFTCLGATCLFSFGKCTFKSSSMF